MGRWYVKANIPTIFDKETINNVEDYKWDADKKVIDVSFSYKKDKSSLADVILQRCTVVNDTKTEWAVSPKVAGLFYIPIGIPYLILDCAEDYSNCIIGVPDRSYLWIMTRTRENDDKGVILSLITKAVERFGYDRKKVMLVTQDWEPALFV